MSGRLRDALVPRRAGVPGADRGYRRLLRWAALPVTDRRWAAPLSAVALGFGLFAGVAIGPGTAGTFATAPLQLVEVPSGDASAPEVEKAAAGDTGSPPPEKPEALAGESAEEAPFVPAVPLEDAPPEAIPGEESPGQAAPKAKGKPAEPEEQLLAGTVVHVNPAAGSYTVAEEGGVMSAIHAAKLPPAGSEVEVSIRALANGTLAEAGKREKTGASARTTLAGIVTFLSADPAAPAFTISNRGVSVLVHAQPDPAGAPPQLPALGAYASADVAIDEEGVLWQRQLSAAGAPFAHSDFEGIVAAVEPASAQLLISADDVREAGQDLVFAVPPALDTSALVVGDSVLVGGDIGLDGSLTLTGLASDERLKGAEDEKATQGDLVPEQAKGAG